MEEEIQKALQAAQYDVAIGKINALAAKIEKLRQKADSEEQQRKQIGELREIHRACTFELNILVLLVETLLHIDFEGRKDVVALFAVLVKLGYCLRNTTTGSEPTDFENYLVSEKVVKKIMDNYARVPEISLSYGMMLRTLSKYDIYSLILLDQQVLYDLFHVARVSSNFDLASDAFLSVKELLTKQKTSSANWIIKNLEEFFAKFHSILLADVYTPAESTSQSVSSGKEEESRVSSSVSSSDLYVVQRQSLKLLSDMLLDRAFSRVMLKYIDSEEYLKVHMQFLRSSSKTIQFEAFHVFKIFAANPAKKPRVTQLLYQNREKLIPFLGTFLQEDRTSDEQFLQDKATVIQKLQELELPKDPQG